MTPLFLFIICFIIPGVGQLFLKDYKKGIIIIATNIILGFILSFLIQVSFISFWISQTICVIWAIYNMYDHIEKRDSRKIANKNIFLSTSIMLVIIPSTLILVSKGVFKGITYVVDEYVNEDKTKAQMITISNKLEKHRDHYKAYPKNYNEFISKKPIWNHFKTDAWNIPYRYQLTDSVHYTLISAGKDGTFDTEDDLIEGNSL